MSRAIFSKNGAFSNNTEWKHLCISTSGNQSSPTKMICGCALCPVLFYLKAIFGVLEREIHGTLDALFNLARLDWPDV